MIIMNDFNQSTNQIVSGFEEYTDLKTSIIPDFNQIITKKVETIKGKFDPYKLMVKKKEVDSGEVKDDTPKQTWPEKDIKFWKIFVRNMV